MGAAGLDCGRGSISARAEEPAPSRHWRSSKAVDLRAGGGAPTMQVAEFTSLVKEHYSTPGTGPSNEKGTLMLHQLLRRLAQG